MKSKTELAKEHLIIAMKLLDTNSLSEARFNIGRAIRDIEKVEGKQEKRSELQASVADQWKEKIKSTASNLLSPKESLNQIEKMIDVEKNKLDKKIEPKNLDTLLG